MAATTTFINPEWFLHVFLVSSLIVKLIILFICNVYWTQSVFANSRLDCVRDQIVSTYGICIIVLPVTNGRNTILSLMNDGQCFAIRSMEMIEILSIVGLRSFSQSQEFWKELPMECHSRKATISVVVFVIKAIATKLERQLHGFRKFEPMAVVSPVLCSAYWSLKPLPAGHTLLAVQWGARARRKLKTADPC